MEKEGFSDDGEAHGVVGETSRRQTTSLEKTNGQTISQVPPRAGLKIGGWRGFFQRGFHWSVNRRKKLMLVYSSSEMEVNGKSRHKKLSTAGCSDDSCGFVTTVMQPEFDTVI